MKLDYAHLQSLYVGLIRDYLNSAAHQRREELGLPPDTTAAHRRARLILCQLELETAEDLRTIAAEARDND